MPQISPSHDAFFSMQHFDYKTRHLLFNRMGAGHAFPPVLDYLVERDGCSQREIGLFLHREPATVTTTVDNMVRAGLVEREMDKADRRRVKLHITEKGLQKQAELRATAAELDRVRLMGFTDQEREQFRLFCLRVSRNLQQYLAEDAAEPETEKKG